jgi:hypothetical protein
VRRHHPANRCAIRALHEPADDDHVAIHTRRGSEGEVSVQHHHVAVHRAAERQPPLAHRDRAVHLLPGRDFHVPRLTNLRWAVEALGRSQRDLRRELDRRRVAARRVRELRTRGAGRTGYGARGDAGDEKRSHEELRDDATWVAASG